MSFNIAIIILLQIAQLTMVVLAFNVRGYFAVGGEFLMVPTILIVTTVRNKIKKERLIKNGRDNEARTSK